MWSTEFSLGYASLTSILIFHELRKIGKVKNHVPHSMDGKMNVSDTFANVYQNLYNSADDRDETL